MVFQHYCANYPARLYYVRYSNRPSWNADKVLKGKKCGNLLRTAFCFRGVKGVFFMASAFKYRLEAAPVTLRSRSCAGVQNGRAASLTHLAPVFAARINRSLLAETCSWALPTDTCKTGCIGLGQLSQVQHNREVRQQKIAKVPDTRGSRIFSVS